MFFFISFFLIINFGENVQFIENGNFEEDLANGWTEIISSSDVIINRDTNYDSDPDYEVMIECSGNNYGMLYQIIKIATLDLEFSIDAKLYSWTTGSWAGSAVCIYYLDDNDSTLGVTRIYSKTPDCPWSNSSTEHLIEAVDSFWHYYSFNIANELSNLTGVNPIDVKKLKLSLLDTTYNC